MDRLDELTLFLRIVERGNFSRAAADLGMSRPAATAAMQALERRLGTRLLHRTTRHVAPTQEGDAYYRRCKTILADLEAADRDAAGAISGVVRVDVAGSLARLLLLPALPHFLAQHPGLSVHLGEGERYVDLVREGVDCVIRAGALGDSGLVGQQLGFVDEITCASPDYINRHGTPKSPDALDGHMMVAFVSSQTGQPIPLEFTCKGRVLDVMLPARLSVRTADTMAAAARHGLGLVQAPRLRFADDLASGTLVEVLTGYPPTPTPISILYPKGKERAPRVRAFADWMAARLRSQLSPS